VTGVAESFVRVVGPNPVVQALVGGVAIALANLVGASLVLVWRNPSERSLDGALGFAAGVMLAASFTSLVLPGIDYAGGDPLPVLFGLVLGALFLDRADGLVPHAHYLVTGKRRADANASGAELPVDADRLAPVVPFVLAITLHNVPEGLAVGVGSGSGDVPGALALAFAIGMQNVPEGLAVSIAAVNAWLAAGSTPRSRGWS